MQNVICAIAKCENIYINNWIKYHLTLGFDHIYLFDNNDSTTDNIKNYIDKQFMSRITIFNVNDIHKQGFQNECYTKFYTDYNTTFDWCAFIDIDEFIECLPNITIADWLADPIFQQYEVIRLQWRIYGDDDKIERDLSIPVNDFFKKEITESELSLNCKSIIRGKLVSVNICSSHLPLINERLPKQCNCVGEEICCKIGDIAKHPRKVWLNHYITKTLSEFIAQKLNRTDCQFEKRKLNMQYFWRVNNKTKQKIDFLKKKGII